MDGVFCRTMLDTEYHYTQYPGMELVLTRTAGKQYPWHIHMNHWVIGQILQGLAEVETRTAARITSGQHFIVPPGKVHRLNIASHSSLAVLCIHVSETDQDITDKLASLLQSLRTRYPSATSFLASTVCPLFKQSHLLAFESGDALDKLTEETPVRRIMHRLVENPEEPLPLAEMAAQMGYSPWHALRLFREETGLTPHAFQLLCRLRKVRGFLRKGVHSVEAAMSAGFSDQSHMHKAFKRLHHLTPRQFQQASFMITE